MNGWGKRFYLIVQTVLCVLLTVLLAILAVDLYQENVAYKADHPLEWIYTRERVAEKFLPMAPLSFIFLGLVFAGLIFSSASRPVHEEMPSSEVVKIHRELLASRPLRPGKAVQGWRAVLIFAAVILIAAGVFNGSSSDVFYKAVKICTECIGLG
ncbi:MAG: hypothetical protein K6E38_08445 [Fretibacterium sp.]|nr:hypothetical protein [Fretibacterium sp.]